MKEFRELNEALDRCCQLAICQPLPGKQLVLMADGGFASSWLCSVNRRRSKPKVNINTQELRSSSFWLTDVHAGPNQNVHLRKSFFSQLLGIQRISTYILGCHQTRDNLDRYQNSHQILSNKIDSLALIECLRLCNAISFYRCRHSRKNEHRSRFFILFRNGSY